MGIKWVTKVPFTFKPLPFIIKMEDLEFLLAERVIRTLNSPNCTQKRLDWVWLRYEEKVIDKFDSNMYVYHRLCDRYDKRIKQLRN